MEIEISSEKLEALKESITCSITQEIFLDPVIIPACGHSFERTALNKSLALRMQCPLCRVKVTMSDLRRNYALVETVDAIVDIFPEMAAEQFLSKPYLLDLLQQSKSKQLLKILQAHPNWLTTELKDGQTILIAAISSGKTAVVNMLLQNFQFDLNQMHQPNPLLHAMQSSESNAEIVSLLLAKGADPKVIADDGGTALMIGLWFNFTDRVQALLNSGKDLNINQQLKRTRDSALTLAASKSNLKIFQTILNQPQVNINASNRKGKTALYMAASQGHVDKIKLLLQHAEVDVVSETPKGKTALSIASQHAHANVVALLTSLPAQMMMLKNLLQRKDFLKSASLLAEIYHNIDGQSFSQVIQDLLDSNAEVWPAFAIVFYQTCLPTIVERNDLDLLNTLISLAHKDVLNDYVQGFTFCQWAVRFKQFGMLHHIMSHHRNKVDLDLISKGSVNGESVTALSLAVLQEEDEQVINYLLACHANPLLPKEKSALFNALLNNKNNTSQLFLPVLLKLCGADMPSDYFSNFKREQLQALYCDFEIFKQILSLPVVRLNEKYEGTPYLHHAVANNNVEKIKVILLRPEVNFWAKDSQGKDALAFSKLRKTQKPVNELLGIFNVSLTLLSKRPRQKMALDDLLSITPQTLNFFVEAMRVRFPENENVEILFGFISQLLHIKLADTDIALTMQDKYFFKKGIDVLNRFFLLAHDSYYQNHHNWEKSIRREAFQQLKNILQTLPPDEQIDLLQWARKQPLFAYHRNFLALGRTTTVIEIDQLISKISNPLTLPLPQKRRSCFIH